MVGLSRKGLVFSISAYGIGASASSVIVDNAAKGIEKALQADNNGPPLKHDADAHNSLDFLGAQDLFIGSMLVFAFACLAVAAYKDYKARGEADRQKTAYYWSAAAGAAFLATGLYALTVGVFNHSIYGSYMTSDMNDTRKSVFMSLYSVMSLIGAFLFYKGVKGPALTQKYNLISEDTSGTAVKKATPVWKKLLAQAEAAGAARKALRQEQAARKNNESNTSDASSSSSNNESVGSTSPKKNTKSNF